MSPRTDAKTTPQQIAELYEEVRRLHTLIANAGGAPTDTQALEQQLASLEAAVRQLQSEPTGGTVIVGGAPNPRWEPILANFPGPVVVATGQAWDYVEFDSTLDPIRFTSRPGPVGDDMILDVLADGVSVFLTPPRILDGEETVLAVPDFPDLLEGAAITIDTIQVGSTSPGSNLVAKTRYTEVAA